MVNGKLGKLGTYPGVSPKLPHVRQRLRRGSIRRLGTCTKWPDFRRATKPAGDHPVHALRILHRCLTPLLTHIHRRRLETLLEAVAASISGPRLTLTDIGRRFTGTTRLAVPGRVESRFPASVDPAYLVPPLSSGGVSLAGS